jgi:hypothetical protein
MTRFAIDASTALRLIEDEREVDERHALVGPALLRSDALAALYRAVREGRLDEKTGRARLEGIAALKIRLLGDRVSRANAWKVAARLDWGDTRPAEYLAVALLQADAFIPGEAVLASAAHGIVPVADYEALFR